MSNVMKFAERACILLLAVLLFVFVLSFVPFGSDGSRAYSAEISFDSGDNGDKDGSNGNVSVPSFAPEKVEPVLRGEIAKGDGKGRVSVVVRASGDVGGAVKRSKGKVRGVSGGALYTVDVPLANVYQLASETNVVRVYPSYTYYALLDSSVPVVRADSFWNAGVKGGNVKVAVLDSGIDKNHPMLAGRVVAESDFSGSGSADDKVGHGTHVAGIAAGSASGGGKYDGVAPAVEVMNGKVVGDDGKGSTGSLASGIDWAVGNGADVISISLGSPTSVDPLVEESLQAAVDAGVVVVAASGNCGSGCPSGACGGFRGVMSPGSSKNVIAVGAVSDNGELACFSSGGIVDGVGIKPDLVAPGVDVFSSVPGNGYASMSGTSMAAPHVSGAAALILSKSPELSPSDVRSVLEGSAVDLGAAGKDVSFGSGLLDLSAAFGFGGGVEFSVGFEKELLIGDVQHIAVDVSDDVFVTGVNGTLFVPGNSEFHFKFVQGGSSYVYDFAGTDTAGEYGLGVVIKHVPVSESDGSAGVAEREAVFSGSFRVMPPFSGNGNVGAFNVSSVQVLSSNLTANLSFSGATGKDVAIIAQLVSNDSGRVAQYFRTVAGVPAPDVSIPAPSHSYSFDSDGSDSAGSLALSLVGDAHISPIAKSGSGSLALDGGGDRAVTNSMETSMESGSVVAWINLTAIIGNYVIFAQSKSGDSDNGVCMNWQNDMLRFFVNDITGLRNATADLPASQLLNNWTHVAGSWENGGNVSLYVDGVRVASNTLGAAVGLSANAGFSYSAICGSDFQGHIDDARVWIGKSLSEGEAKLLYGGRDAVEEHVASVTFPLDVPAGNYTLLLVSDFGGVSVVNETNITVVDDLPPAITNVAYSAGNSPLSPRIVSFDVYEHSPSFNLSVLSYMKDSGEPYFVNYSESVLPVAENNMSVSVVLFDIGGNLGSAGISVCDGSGNCAEGGRVELPAGECAGKQLLVVKNTESETVFEKAASSIDGVCLSSLDAGVSGTPPYEYLAKFDGVIWSAGDDAAGIASDDAEALGDYFSENGKLVVEGSGVADALADSSFLEFALHSELKGEAGVGVLQEANRSAAINVTMPHFVLRGLGSRLLFNVSRDRFPDALSPLKSAVELAAWDSPVLDGSAMVAYERRGKKSLFLPFSIEALGGADDVFTADLLANVLSSSYALEGAKSSSSVGGYVENGLLVILSDYSAEGMIAVYDAKSLKLIDRYLAGLSCNGFRRATEYFVRKDGLLICPALALGNPAANQEGALQLHYVNTNTWSLVRTVNVSLTEYDGEFLSITGNDELVYVTYRNISGDLGKDTYMQSVLDYEGNILSTAEINEEHGSSTTYFSDGSGLYSASWLTSNITAYDSLSLQPLVSVHMAAGRPIPLFGISENLISLYHFGGGKTHITVLNREDLSVNVSRDISEFSPPHAFGVSQGIMESENRLYSVSHEEGDIYASVFSLDTLELMKKKLIFPDTGVANQVYGIVDSNNWMVLSQNRTPGGVIARRDVRAARLLKGENDIIKLSERLALNVVEWLLQDSDSGVDLAPVRVDLGVQFEGIVKGTVVIESSSPVGNVPAINVSVDGVPVAASFVGFSRGGVNSASVDEFRINYSFEAGLGAGYHSVEVFVNSDFAIMEPRYTNNFRVFSVPVYPLVPDLLPGELSYGYDDSKSAIAVDLLVLNMGGSPASAVVRLYLNDSEVFSSMLDFGAGGVKALSALLPVPKGVYRFKAAVDADGSVSEHNESNNILEAELFICSREKVLVVEDNTAPLRTSLNPGSAGLFVDILQRVGYCVVDYLHDEDYEELFDEFHAPPVEFANSFAAIVWSAGDYSGGILGNDDLVALGNYSVPVLFEGADLASELSAAGLLQSLLGSEFSGDKVAGMGEDLKLNEHAILSGVSHLFVGNSSPYPDGLSVTDGFSVAEWGDGFSAIVVNKAGGRKYAYYAFSLNALPDEDRKGLVTGTVEWLLFNARPDIVSVEATAYVNETGKASIRAEVADADDKDIFVSVNDSRFVEVTVEECGGIGGLSCGEGAVCVVPDGCADCLGACHAEENSVVRKFEWETTYEDAGSYTVNLTASDGNIEVSEMLNIVVENLNRPAVVKNAFENLTISENESLEFRIEAYDADNDKLELEVLMGMRETPQEYNSPKFYGAEFEPETGVFSWTPDFEQEGVYVFRIDVLEYTSPFGVVMHRKLINVTVLNTNRAPTVKFSVVNEIKQGSVLFIGEGLTLSLFTEGSDEDGDALSYWWLVNGSRFLDGSSFIFNTDYESSGDYLVSAVVSDGVAEMAISFTLRVADTLECSAGEVRSCPLTQGVCSGSVDSCIAGLWNGCSAAEYGRHYESGEATCDGLDNDCDGAVDEDRVCNMPPELSLIGNKSVYVHSPLSFIISASDDDNDAVSYRVEGLPGGAFFYEQSGRFFWIPRVPGGYYMARFIASDGLAVDVEDVNFTVLGSVDETLIPPVSRPDYGQGCSYAEVCGNYMDDNCNGVIDEDCRQDNPPWQTGR